MRPLIVGEAPARTGDPSRPLRGRCGTLLATLCRMDRRAFERTFQLANVFDAWPGQAAKGSKFDSIVAQVNAGVMKKKRFKGGRLVILLGFRVARAFRARTVYFKRQRLVFANATVVVVPHPSRVNRWWNEPSHVSAACRFFEAAAREHRR